MEQLGNYNRIFKFHSVNNSIHQKIHLGEGNIMSTPAPALSLPSSKLPTPSQGSDIQPTNILGANSDKLYRNV